MRVAFIGGTRFIGHAAAADAVARGHDVTVIHRGEHRCDVLSARRVIADRADRRALSDALGGVDPEVVVDTRAMTRGDAEATAFALRAVAASAVVLSSQDVYAQFGRLNGLPAPNPEPIVTEGSPLTVPFPFRTLGPHEGGPDYDKKDVEEVFLRAAGEGVPSVTVLRLPAVYGDRDPRRRFGAAFDLLEAGALDLPCAAGAAFRMTHAHVRDVARAIVLAAELRAPGGRVLNVGEAETPTMRERVEALAAVMGRHFEWTERTDAMPAGLEILGVMPNDFVVSSARLRAELGFMEVTTPAERMADLVAWLRSTR